MNIDLNTQDKHIVKKIKNSVGQTIEFSNGCWGFANIPSKLTLGDI